MEKWIITNSTEGSSIEWENRVFPEDEPDRGRVIVLVDIEHEVIAREEEFLRQQEAGWDH